MSEEGWEREKSRYVLWVAGPAENDDVGTSKPRGQDPGRVPGFPCGDPSQRGSSQRQRNSDNTTEIRIRQSAECLLLSAERIQTRFFSSNV